MFCNSSCDHVLPYSPHGDPIPTKMHVRFRNWHLHSIPLENSIDNWRTIIQSFHPFLMQISHKTWEISPESIFGHSKVFLAASGFSHLLIWPLERSLCLICPFFQAQTLRLIFRFSFSRDMVSPLKHLPTSGGMQLLWALKSTCLLPWVWTFYYEPFYEPFVSLFVSPKKHLFASGGMNLLWDL